ncbi:MAG: hypothetical protein EON54_08620 [Alcaligenaceae bacterium]|nr:MAG: hypothetical protein EON54_08620 [Alcaligenaceae bacterium]
MDDLTPEDVTEQVLVAVRRRVLFDTFASTSNCHSDLTWYLESRTCPEADIRSARKARKHLSRIVVALANTIREMDANHD